MAKQNVLKPYFIDISPPFQVEIEEKSGIKNANASMKGTNVLVKLPRHWSRSFKEEVAQDLVNRVVRKYHRDAKRREVALKQEELISMTDLPSLTAWVKQLNAETLNAPLKGVRIGSAKFSRMAQVNLQTGIVTISKYSLSNVPKAALRYLIIHELAHFSVRGHDARFWEVVSRFVPDYPVQSRRMKEFHHWAVQQDLSVIQKDFSDTTSSGCETLDKQDDPSNTYYQDETSQLVMPISLLESVEVQSEFLLEDPKPVSNKNPLQEWLERMFRLSRG